MACCADVLLHVGEEIHEAGDDVAKELEKPISKLTECVSIASAVFFIS
jgi:hypothetical protein